VHLGLFRVRTVLVVTIMTVMATIPSTVLVPTIRNMMVTISSAMTLALYHRISDDPLNLRVGVERQRTDTLALAARRFPDEPTVSYEDNDRSAIHGRRPEYERLLGDLRAGTVTGLIAYNLDRLVRQPRELEALIDLKISRVLTAEGDLDLTTHDGQLQARILVAVAKKASDDTSRRTRRAAVTRREAGWWVGGRMPYPYVQRTGVPSFRSETALCVARRAAIATLDGTTLRAICREITPLDTESPRTPTGWRRAITSPAWVGVNTAGVRGQWEPVVTPLEYERL
jgi:site-specific DNA recombinase